MTTRLRYAWIPIVTASALALTACGGEDDTGGLDATDVQGTYAEPAQPAQPNEPGNTFEDEGVSGYVDAASDPLSTFALDVDNGSYRIAQAYVAQGTRPPSESVRAEEWVNAFAYGDPAPTEADLAVRTESGVRPDGGRRAAGPGGRHRARGRGRGAAVGQPDPGRGPLGQHGRGQPHRAW